ncbi:AAA family ATPase [Rhizobium sp. ICMP 5592]|uniref:AAA family ATPase n=1 Tax=Rhizobium sp. ICMP 5592 TaxID=2292445 RepID=UPI001295F674|nr:AAA family ATPase [Rhizobium sp. ICMP 5592]MQB43196.1 hypothetical protein [Rhizobium sp. ICMP 5592]
MKIRSLSLSNFRKFRAPKTISGFTDGLNIVVEPNEAGKSTLLEALRATFFIRHSAKTELVRSFCPFGDDVAPKVAITFEIEGERWEIEKQFLKSPHIWLTGPPGRIESDAAEDKLQSLLGFEKGNNRGGDLETRGALGLLWVEQASALAVEAPGRLVRDNIRSALESEVGAVVGGRRFELVKARVEDSYAALRTPRSGRPTGRLAESEATLNSARERRAQSESLLQQYEQALTALDEARSSKRLIERDLADPEQAKRKLLLVEDLRTAETSQLRLASASARYAEAELVVLGADQQLQRIQAAVEAADDGGATLTKLDALLAEQQADFDKALAELNQLRLSLNDARSRRTEAEHLLTQARAISTQQLRRGGIMRARAQLAEVQRLEAELGAKATISDTNLPLDALEELNSLDRKVTEARALFAAGAVGLDIEVVGDHPVKIDGILAKSGHHDVVTRTEVSIGTVAKLVITPVNVGGRSAEANLRSAEEALASALTFHGVTSYGGAVTQSEHARAAQQETAAIKRQIEALCPGDIALGLPPGAAALKSWLSEIGGDEETAIQPPSEADLVTLEEAFNSMRDEELKAAAVLETTQARLHDTEKSLVKLKAERAAAESVVIVARERLQLLVQEKDRDAITTKLVTDREELARRAEAYEQAKASAAAFDAEKLRRSIANIDQSEKRAQEERIELVARIASLESTIASEGPKGLAGMAAEAREVEQAAAENYDRLRQEADMLELLRTTLRNAGEDASKTFLGPVTRRAARYVERILPGAGLTFNDEMGLVNIARGGIDEASGDLSRGTQEQLAVLTRLAFADLLIEKGAPVSLILDDPLVYSDDTRLETMTDILLEASERMQVVLLTCRSKAFRHVDANRISLRDL